MSGGGRMGRKDDIQQKIIEVLINSKRLLSLEDIIRETGLSRDAVRNNISILLDTNPAVKYVDIGKRKKYYYRDPETLMGVPIRREMKDKITGIMYVITSEANNDGIMLGRTAIQKIMWKFDKQFGYNLPFVDYIFGKISLYAPLILYSSEETDIPEEQMSFIREHIHKYGAMNRKDIAREQYREEHMDEHSLMMDIRDAIENREIGKISMFTGRLARLLISRELYKEAELLLDIPYYIERVGSISPEIKDLSEKIMKRISISFLKSSLIKMGYDKELAEEYIRPEKGMIMNDIREIISDIERQYPVKVGDKTRSMVDNIKNLYSRAKSSSDGKH